MCRIELHHPRRSAFGDYEDARGGQRCGGSAAEREVGKVDHVAESESADGRARRGRAVDLQGASAAGERDQMLRHSLTKICVTGPRWPGLQSSISRW